MNRGGSARGGFRVETVILAPLQATSLSAPAERKSGCRFIAVALESLALPDSHALTYAKWINTRSCPREKADLSCSQGVSRERRQIWLRWHVEGVKRRGFFRVINDDGTVRRVFLRAVRTGKGGRLRLYPVTQVVVGVGFVDG